MPHDLNLELFAFSSVVIEVSVVRCDRNFTHQLFNCHRIDIGNRAPTAPLLSAIVTGLVVAAYIFKHKAVRHLA